MNYTAYEVQNANSRREGGISIQAESLNQAKSQATRAQVFQGTVMVLTTESGAVVARRYGGRTGRWVYA